MSACPICTGPCFFLGGGLKVMAPILTAFNIKAELVGDAG